VFRTFVTLTGNTSGTIAPLTDKEIGQSGELPWDGIAGEAVAVSSFDSSATAPQAFSRGDCNDVVCRLSEPRRSRRPGDRRRLRHRRRHCRALRGTGRRGSFIDLDAAAAKQLLTALGDKAARCHFASADLRDAAALRAAIADLRGRLGRPITVLVNNAARDDRHSIAEVTPEYWDERMATNLKHQFFAAQAVREDMIAAGGGSIVNMSSISFVRAQGNMPVYLTAKSAVIGLTRALARDLGPHHIRVNAVLPGWVMTERQLKLWVTPEA
jgi:NAD(P)-dependent dehydrogenase (short-subunit alcohol dehydrogenase family)